MVGEALSYWQRTIPFQILFSVLYFIIYFTLTFLIFNHFGLIEQIKEISAFFPSDVDTFTSRYKELLGTTAYMDATLWTVGSTVIAWPLNLGMLRIYEKIDRKEPLSINDLFAGYEGKNFFIFLLYALFWNAVSFFAKLVFFLWPVWVFITLLMGPLMFLGKLNFKDAFRMNLSNVRENFGVTLVVLIFGVLLSYCGFLLCGIGLLFTFPFWNAILYVFYKKIFPAQTISQNIQKND